MIKWILSKCLKILEEPLTEEELFLSKIDRKGLVNKYQALRLLHISSLEFNELIRQEKFPKGIRIPGDKILYWTIDDLIILNDELYFQ